MRTPSPVMKTTPKAERPAQKVHTVVLFSGEGERRWRGGREDRASERVAARAGVCGVVGGVGESTHSFERCGMP
jgi:hypothetical protein